jgi:hypothetical protein
VLMDWLKILYACFVFFCTFLIMYLNTSVFTVCFIADVHKIPARVQCTVQVCELAVSNLHPPPYRSRQIICLSHSPQQQQQQRPSLHQLHARPGRSVPCTRARDSSTHHRTLCTACAPLFYSIINEVWTILVCWRMFWKWQWMMYVRVGAK